jgi:hypothetical protein
MVWSGLKAFALAVMLTMAIIVAGPGCYGGSIGRTAEESPRSRLVGKMVAEAYSFNARIRREGKPTSIRLEIYQTDSLLGLSGRGYLGKGALKGRLTSDSLEVFFPASKEYVYEALGDLLTSSECPLPLSDLDIISLFYSLADSVSMAGDLRVAANYRKADRPEYIVYAEGCPWQLELTYDKRKTGWRLREFDFTDGDGISIWGKRERYKSRAEIKPRRFEVVLPPDVVRVRP